MTIRTPSGLRTRGRKFWKATMAAYELSDAEAEILLEACRTLDNLDDLDAAVRADGPTATGSAGQTVVHPALTEARGQRVVLHRLLASLALPDDDDEVLQPARTTAARTAATARWKPPTRR